MLPPVVLSLNSDQQAYNGTVSANQVKSNAVYAIEMTVQVAPGLNVPDGIRSGQLLDVPPQPSDAVYALSYAANVSLDIDAPDNFDLSEACLDDGTVDFQVSLQTGNDTILKESLNTYAQVGLNFVPSEEEETLGHPSR